MLMILARLGLRAPEVIAIQLDDIDLPEDAGEAIVDYIRNGRRGSSRTLFLSNKPPYRKRDPMAALRD